MRLILNSLYRFLFLVSGWCNCLDICFTSSSVMLRFLPRDLISSYSSSCILVDKSLKPDLRIEESRNLSRWFVDWGIWDNLLAFYENCCPIPWIGGKIFLESESYFSFCLSSWVDFKDPNLFFLSKWSFGETSFEKS